MKKLTDVLVTNISLTKTPAVEPFRFIDAKKRLVMGVVLRKEFVDQQGETLDAVEVRKAMDRWQESGCGTFDVEHTGKEVSVVVKAWGCASADTQSRYGLDEPLPDGAWYIVAQLDPETFQKVEKGELRGFSIEGVSAVEKADETVAICKDEEVEVTPDELAEAIANAVDID